MGFALFARADLRDLFALCGEDELASAAMSLSTADVLRIARRAHDLGMSPRYRTVNRCIVRAAIEFFEGAERPAKAEPTDWR